MSRLEGMPAGHSPRISMVSKCLGKQVENCLEQKLAMWELER